MMLISKSICTRNNNFICCASLLSVQPGYVFWRIHLDALPVAAAKRQGSARRPGASGLSTPAPPPFGCHSRWVCIKGGLTAAQVLAGSLRSCSETESGCDCWGQEQMQYLPGQHVSTCWLDRSCTLGVEVGCLVEWSGLVGGVH
eukprot:1157771-Pelagomonas_calceolata.AAC.1